MPNALSIGVLVGLADGINARGETDQPQPRELLMPPAGLVYQLLWWDRKQAVSAKPTHLASHS